ncbi:hypothetical protein D3C81_1907600 [compost metagenome]
MRRQSVLHRDHHLPGLLSKRPAQVVMGIEAAYHIAAAMEIQQGALLRAARRLPGVQPALQPVTVTGLKTQGLDVLDLHRDQVHQQR